MIDKISRPAALLHTTAIVPALVVFVVILTYTGSANLPFAIIGGFGTGLLIYLAVHVVRDKAGEE